MHAMQSSVVSRRVSVQVLFQELRNIKFPLQLLNKRFRLSV